MRGGGLLWKLAALSRPVRDIIVLLSVFGYRKGWIVGGLKGAGPGLRRVIEGRQIEDRLFHDGCGYVYG